MDDFVPFELRPHVAFDLSDDPYPSRVAAWTDRCALELPDGGSHFGFVADGKTELSCASGSFRLHAGMYFSAPGPLRLVGGAGLAITRVGFRGFFQLGGPVESIGRLRYIDGCTDSLLVAPVLLGDPCLNLLHIPPRTRQSAHTHPSLRVGLIAEGTGACVTPAARYPLRSGLGFVIPAGSLHSFHTGDEPLLVIAYHPESDFGPTHECHPMVNRTLLPGRGGTP